jgi:tetratricopeptide (TPR) repeat protein
MNWTRHISSSWLTPFVIVFAAYQYTCLPSAGPRDSSEIAAFVPQLGLMHPPGYPLILLLGKILSTVPLGNDAFRLNGLSTIFGALSSAGLFLLLCRLERTLGTEPFLSAWATLPCLFFGLSPTIWEQSTAPEVFMLNIFLFVALVLTATAQLSPQTKLNACSFIFGLGLSNHHTIAFSFPILMLLAPELKNLSSARERSRASFSAITCLGIGLCPYLLFFRGKPLLDPEAWQELASIFLRLKFGTFSLGLSAPANVTPTVISPIETIIPYWMSILETFTPAGVLLGLFGIYRLKRGSPQLNRALLATLILSGPFFMWLANAPTSEEVLPLMRRFHIFPHLVFSIYFGIGFLGMLALANKKIPAAGLGLFALSVLIVRSIGAFPMANKRSNFVIEDHLRNISRILPSNSTVMVRGDTQVFLLNYLHETRRKDLQITHVPFILENGTVKRTNSLLPPTGQQSLAAPIFTTNNLIPDFQLSAQAYPHALGPLSRFVPQSIRMPGNSLEDFNARLILRNDIDGTGKDFFIKEIYELYAQGLKFSGDEALLNGRFAEALDLYRRVPLMDDSPKILKKSLTSIIQLQHHMSYRGFKTDTELLRKSIRAISTLATIDLSDDDHSILATGYYLLGEYGNVVKECSLMSENDFRRHKLAGTAYALLKDFPAAEKEYSRALSIRPDADDIRRNYESVARALGRHQ